MGYGLHVVNLSQELREEVGVVLDITLGLMGFMYIFDSHYWPILPRVMSWTTILVSFGISMCLLVAYVPYGPICIFTLLLAISVYAIKNDHFSSVSVYDLIRWNYYVYVRMAIVILIAFFYWCSIKF